MSYSSKELESEKWLPVPNYEGRYEVSDIGRIKSIPQGLIPIRRGGFRPHLGGLLKLGLDRYGYVRFMAKQDGRSEVKYIHRAVAIAFLPNPSNLPAVNHIDGNPRNNRLSNLEWVSYKTNSCHAVKMGLIKTVPLSVRTQISLAYQAQSPRRGLASSIAREYGVSHTSVQNIIANNRKLASILQSLSSQASPLP